MHKVRIGVVGAGLIGKRHARLVSESPRAELVGIADPAPGVDTVTRAHGVPSYAGIADLLTAGDVDAVIVATPNHLHVQHGLACVEAGIPVLIEKPIASSLDEAEQLADAAEAAGVPVLIGHHRRHSSILQRARDAIDLGLLGDLVAVSGTALYAKPDNYFEVAPWRKDVGGGPILINLIHEIDALRMLCGEIESVETIASNAQRGFPVEDTVALALRFTNGALGSFILSDAAASVRSWENLSGEDLAYPRYAGTDCYTIAGTSGSIEIPTLRLRTVSDERSWWKPMDEQVLESGDRDPLKHQLEHFCDVVDGTAAPVVTARDATRTLEIVLNVASQSRTMLAA